MNSREIPGAGERRELIITARRAVSTDLGWLGRQFARRIAAFLDEALAPAELNSAQLTLICLIAASTDDTIAGLARAADLDASTLSRNLAHLQQAGLVEIVTTETDRRRRSVWLTEEGLRTMSRGLEAWRKAHDRLQSRLLPSLVDEVEAALQSLPPVRG